MEIDYFLRVVVRDMGLYSNFLMTTLLKHTSVQDCKTRFVLDRIKATTALPFRFKFFWVSWIRGNPYSCGYG